MIVTIDGPAGTGKSTVAKRVAKRLDFEYFDTGAMYRAATWYLMQKDVSLEDPKKIAKALKSFEYRIKSEDGEKRYFVGKRDVSEEIRTEEISKRVSPLSAIACVRKILVKKQKKWAKGKKIVVEGRDMGSVVFPKAKLKIFLTASAEVRAKRRVNQLKEQFPEKADTYNEQEILKEIEERDKRDSTRAISPLCCPKNAFLVDTSNDSIEEVTDNILKIYRREKNLSFKRFFSMKWGYGLVVMLCSGFFRLFYHLKVYGLEHYIEKRAILAANHQSNLDPPAIAVSCPEEIFFLAKGKLFSVPVLSSLIRYLNTLPVSGLAADLSTFKLIAKMLKQERKVLLFPEGTRSYDGKILPLQSGVGFLAQMTNSPVIPVYIKGTGKIWPRKKKFPKLWGRVTCIFGSPIMPTMWKDLPKKESIAWITKRLEKSYEDLIEWERNGSKGTPP